MTIDEKLPELRNALKECMDLLNGQPLQQDINKVRARLNFVLTNLQVDPETIEFTARFESNGSLSIKEDV